MQRRIYSSGVRHWTLRMRSFNLCGPLHSSIFEQIYIPLQSVTCSSGQLGQRWSRLCFCHKRAAWISSLGFILFQTHMHCSERALGTFTAKWPKACDIKVSSAWPWRIFRQRGIVFFAGCQTGRSWTFCSGNHGLQRQSSKPGLRGKKSVTLGL